MHMQREYRTPELGPSQHPRGLEVVVRPHDAPLPEAAATELTPLSHLIVICTNRACCLQRLPYPFHYRDENNLPAVSLLSESVSTEKITSTGSICCSGGSA